MRIVFAKAAMHHKPSLASVAVGRTAEQVEREMWRYLLSELRSIRADISLADLTEALTTAREADIFAVTDVTSLRTTFRGLDDVLLAGANAGAQQAASSLVAGRALDVARSRIRNWVREHAAELVRETMGTSREAIRRTVAAGIEAGRHPVRLAKDVRSSVGLTERQAAAVANRRTWLLDDGMDPERANDLADRYSEKLLDQRAKNIARTESLNSVNQGRAALWEQLQEDGAMPESQEQEWDASQDAATCGECASMHGQRRKVGEAFDAPDGGKVVAPTLHPSCRCVVNLTRGGR